jgi:hypothetical protein
MRGTSRACRSPLFIREELKTLQATVWFSNSRRTLLTQRSATPFCHGLRYAVLFGATPNDFTVETCRSAIIVRALVGCHQRPAAQAISSRLGLGATCARALDA